jgi:cytochrome c peroxidase
MAFTAARATRTLARALARPATATVRGVAATGAVRSMATTAAQSARSSAWSTQRIAAAGLFAGAAGLALAYNLPVATASAARPDYRAVRKDIEDLLESNPDYDDGSYGPLFVRLAWHASGTYDKRDKTGGSNGATMRFKPESNWGANNGLDLARKLLEPIKAKYPSLSYGDLWTLAGVVAVESMGGPTIPWRPGRVDVVETQVKALPDGRLPDAAQGERHVRDIFYRMGFNDREIVALAGAHALGRCHTDRSGYDGPWTRAPTSFSNEYFRELLESKWTKKRWGGPEQFEDQTGQLMMTPADMAMVADAKFLEYVKVYATDEAAFFKDFAAAFSKLLELGVPFPEMPH